MAKYKIQTTTRFDKNLSKYIGKGKRKVSEEEFIMVVNMLANDEKLPASYRDHALTNNFKGYRDCHLKPDVVLIYKKEKDKLILILSTIGSHSEIF